MSDPNSVNPLFPNPTVMPDAYPRKDREKAFNMVETKYGNNELVGHKEYYKNKQSDRKNADRYGMKKK